MSHMTTTTTTTQEIDRADWSEFFNLFSWDHQGWLATVEVLDGTIGPRVEARRIRFEGVSADSRAHGDRIAVTLGEKRDAHITHTISAPTRVRFERSLTDRGTIDTIRIEAAAGPTTLVHFLAGQGRPTVGF